MYVQPAFILVKGVDCYGTRGPQYLDRGTLSRVCPQYLRNQVKSSLFVDFIAFYFIKMHILL